MFRFLARLFAGGLTLGDLSTHLGIPARELRDTEISYRGFHIGKRSGGRRYILAPEAPLKQIQRRIHRRLLAHIGVHERAFGFEKGRSIVGHARRHSGQAVVVRMDLVDFFPSISDTRVERVFRRFGWGRGARRLLTRLCTYEGKLPQGAPTSPKLSNLVCYYLDRRLEGLARRFGARYSRYADDLAFSFDFDDGGAVRGILRRIRLVVGQEGFAVHRRKKLSIRRQHDCQKICGLVVNERPRLPREKRRWLRAVAHHQDHSLPMTISAEQLQGWRSFERMLGQEGSVPRTMAPASRERS